MKLSRTILWTVGTLTMGYVYKKMVNYREKVFDRKLMQQELEVLEGEGGICLG